VDVLANQTAAAKSPRASATTKKGERTCRRTAMLSPAYAWSERRSRLPGQMWWAQQDSNLRPADYESVALPLRHGPAFGRIIPNEPAFRVYAALKAEPEELLHGFLLCTQSR
jgi:hypothetical protein